MTYMHWKHRKVQVWGANRNGISSIPEQNQWSVQTTESEIKVAPENAVLGSQVWPRRDARSVNNLSNSF